MVEALQIYLKAYRSLIVHESVDNSVILSFPLHLAANHRVEITVTMIDSDRYIVSDGGKTLGEMEAVGHSVTQTMMERFERLVSTEDIRIIQGHLLMETKVTELGFAIQTVLEFCKTIGDVYLIHKLREEADKEVIDQVASVLRTSHIHFQRDKKISGELEKHPFDIVVNSNGVPGMAVKVLGGQNTHSTAQIWAYKCEDIRRGHWRKAKNKLVLVYDERNRWSDASKAILESRADVVLSSGSINLLPEALKN